MNPVQGQFDTHDLIRLIVPIGGMIVVVVLAGVGLFLYRRSLFSSGPDNAREQTSSIFESLRIMRDCGELSEDEYQLARRRLVDRASGGSIAPKGDVAHRCRENTFPEVDTGGNPRELRAPPGFDLTGEPLPEPGFSDDGSD